MIKLNGFWDFLTRPMELDPVRAMREHLAKTVLLVITGISMTFTLLGFAGWIVGKIPKDTLAIFFVMALFFSLSYFLCRRGYWKVGGISPLVLLFSAAVYGNFIGGISVPAILLYAITIIMAGMIYGGRIQWIGFILCLAAYCAVAYAHYAGFITRIRTDDTAFYNRVTIVIGSIICIFLLIRFILNQYQRALVAIHDDRDKIKALAENNEELYRRSQQELARRIEAEELLQNKNEELMALNEELTAALEENETTNEELRRTNEDLHTVSEELKSSEEKFRALSEQSLMAIAVVQDSAIVYVNNTFCINSGYSREELSSFKSMEFMNSVHPDDRAMVLQKFLQKTSGQSESSHYVYRGFRKDGSMGWYELYSKRIMFEGKPAIYIVIADRTVEKSNEIVLNEILTRYQAITDNAYEVILVLQDNRIRYVNRRFTDIMGYSVEEAMAIPFLEFVYPEDRPMVDDNYTRRLRGELIEQIYSFRVMTKSGEVRWAETHVAPIEWEGKNAGLNLLTDVTERYNAEEKIRNSLYEKEVLLKEIHHRVKNNFQIIVSLLGLQAGKMMNDEVVRNLKDAQNRIRAMSLIHEKLYKSENLAAIDFDEYLNTMAFELYRSHCSDPSKIGIEVTAERLQLSLERAIPLGLATSELITNAIKYAFPGNKKGTLVISIERPDDERIIVRVKDNGVGLPPSFDPEKTDTLGFKLVYLLVKEQMGGEVAIDRQGGTSVSLKISIANGAKA